MDTHEQTITITEIPTSRPGGMVNDLVETTLANLDAGPMPDRGTLTRAARAVVLLLTLPTHSPRAGTMPVELLVALVASEMAKG